MYLIAGCMVAGAAAYGGTNSLCTGVEKCVSHLDNGGLELRLHLRYASERLLIYKTAIWLPSIFDQVVN